MKVQLPEPVAAGAIAALADNAHPDVRHLVRELKAVVKSRTTSDVLSGAELEAVKLAIDAALVSRQAVDDVHMAGSEALKNLLRIARPKVEKLLARQLLREKGDDNGDRART